MKSEDIYNAWKKRRSRVEVGHSFTEKVMKQVYQYEQRRKSSLFDIQWLVATITVHPLAKAGLIAMGAVVGVARLVFMIIVILSKGVING